jgi:hypothetical protein
MSDPRFTTDQWGNRVSRRHGDYLFGTPQVHVHHQVHQVQQRQQRQPRVVHHHHYHDGAQPNGGNMIPPMQHTNQRPHESGWERRQREQQMAQQQTGRRYLGTARVPLGSTVHLPPGVGCTARVVYPPGCTGYTVRHMRR